MSNDSNATAESNGRERSFPAGRLCLRSAAVFGWCGAVGFGTSSILLGYHPFQSANAYYVGMICGGMGAAAAALYTMFEAFARRGRVVDFLYFGLLTLWSLVVWLRLSVAPEGYGLGPYGAGASMALGAIAWPFRRFRIPRTIMFATIGFGVLMPATHFVLKEVFGIR